MPAYTATAPGKIILMGEHAVVYGQPAIAVPLTEVSARAVVRPAIGSPPGHAHVIAPAVDLDTELHALGSDHPLRILIQAVYKELNLERAPAYQLRITTTIPISAGMGSGAAVSVAVGRALSGFLGSPLPDDRVSALAFEIEKHYHGTPSGIDNTVITYNRPVYFVRGRPVEMIRLTRPLTFVVGDTGIPSPTGPAVADVRRGWQRDRPHYEKLFAEIGRLSLEAREAIQEKPLAHLGQLMSANHELLQQLGVSSAELDALVLAAKKAGAAGAKLSGGGRGGNMIALVDPVEAKKISEELEAAGATHILTTTVQTTN